MATTPYRSAPVPTVERPSLAHRLAHRLLRNRSHVESHAENGVTYEGVRCDDCGLLEHVTVVDVDLDVWSCGTPHQETA
jgi:hypothetical protein